MYITLYILIMYIIYINQDNLHLKTPIKEFIYMEYTDTHIYMYVCIYIYIYIYILCVCVKNNKIVTTLSHLP